MKQNNRIGRAADSKGTAMLSVLISIRPEYCTKIVSGEKTLEIRSTKPSRMGHGTFKCYLYCTKNGRIGDLVPNDPFRSPEARGKVVGEFWCTRIEHWKKDDSVPFGIEYRRVCDSGLVSDAHYEAACLSARDIAVSFGPDVYAWNIRGLKVYETPLSLNAFYTAPGTDSLERPPQSWRYVRNTDCGNTLKGGFKK